MKSSMKSICGIAAAVMTLLFIILSGTAEETGETMLVEAETGELKGHTAVAGNGGNQWVEGFKTAGEDSVSVEVPVSREGFYDIAVIQASQGGHKENPVLLDGQNIGSAEAV